MMFFQYEISSVLKYKLFRSGLTRSKFGILKQFPRGISTQYVWIIRNDGVGLWAEIIWTCMMQDCFSFWINQLFLHV